MSRHIRIDASRLASAKSTLRAAMEKRIGTIGEATRAPLRDTGAFVATELALRTFPSNSAVGLAAGAMRFDLRRVYATPSRFYKILEASAGEKTAKSFYAHWKSGNITRVKQIVRNSGSPVASIIIGETLKPALRESVRDKNGRVMTAYPLQLVTDAELVAHTKIALQEIGKTASGWFACAERLGADGNAVPWKGTARHGNAGGTVSWSQSETGIHLTLTNKSPLAHKHISPGQVDSIIKRGRLFLASRLRLLRTA